MQSATQLQQDFENLAREDAFFDDCFKHTSGTPIQYLNRLETLLLENHKQLFAICQGKPENISYFLNRICCFFINNLGIDRQFRKEIYDYLGRLIAIIEKAAEKPEISDALEPFFLTKNQIEGEPDTPSGFDRLKTTLVKYEKQEEDTESNWQKKQRLGKRLVRYPHLYSSYLVEGGNSSFKQTTYVRQKEHVKDYAIHLHRFLRQEANKDNNYDLADGIALLKSPQQSNWENPTQLPKETLYQSIIYYKKTESALKQISTEIAHRSRTSKLSDTKLLLYKSVVNIFPPYYHKAFLNHKLFICLQGQDSSFNETMTTPALLKMMIDYCFKLLVIDDDRNHFFFIDMISNIGTKRTLSILLQLIHCYPVDPHSHDPIEQKQRLLSALEKRLSMLFKNYEDFDETEMQWLIYFLENFNVASALQFDGLDLSGIQIPLQPKNDQ